MPTQDELLGQVAAAEGAGQLSPTAASQIRRWLTEPPFTPYRDLLQREIAAERWTELDNAFYAILEFGTGGRRGRMFPVGTNVLNDRTMAESARGLADHITAAKGEQSPRSCVIAYDTRHNSLHFAKICASVLAAADFKVFITRQPRATPLLSAAVRILQSDGGIMISASHNPPSDNGFKCYNAHGGQVIPPDDAQIIERVRAASDREIPEIDFEEGVQDGSIRWVGEELDRQYLNDVVAESVSHARALKIVYTPMHGVGESAVAAALIQAGFAQLIVLESQRTPDGAFPSVPGHVANPEIPATLDAAIGEARAQGADLVIASDPDADRIGVAVPTTGDPAGAWTCLNGNQIGVLLTAFIIKQSEYLGRLRPDHYIVTTLVSTQMARALAEREGIRVEDDLLVGFKWIAQRIDDAGHAGFLFGFEESHGYLKGAYARDKDAAVAALLFAELAATVKDRKQTVLEYLDDLYVDVGHFEERLVNRMLEGREGAALIGKLMECFRETPPRLIAGHDVTEVLDFKNHETRRMDGSIHLLPAPSGDLLIFHLAQPGCRFAVRPSGTEPKIKFYLFARSDAHDATDSGKLAVVKTRTSQLLDAMAADIEKYVQAALVLAAE